MHINIGSSVGELSAYKEYGQTDSDSNIYSHKLLLEGVINKTLQLLN